MSTLSSVGKIVIIVCNILVILISLALIICGFILRFSSSWLQPLTKFVLDEIQSTVQNTYGNTDFSTDNFELGPFVGLFAYACIGVGFILLAISILGLLGACCPTPILILVYAIVLTVILVGQIILVIIAFSSPHLIKDTIKPKLKETMEEYNGIQGNSATNVGWNYIMREFACCGTDSFEDFDKTGKGKYKENNKNDNAAIGGTPGAVQAPVACCKTLPASAADRSICAGAGSLPDTTYSYRDKGCFDEVQTSIAKSCNTYFIIFLVFSFLIQIVLIIFAFLLYREKGITDCII